jgi:hypothetical protein
MNRLIETYLQCKGKREQRNEENEMVAGYFEIKFTKVANVLDAVKR